MAAFTDVDKERIRYHMRYPQVEVAVNVFGGTLYAGTLQFVIEKTMDHVNPLTIPRTQKILDRMDAIEDQMFDANERLQASKADVVTLNPNEHAALEATYLRWQGKLSEILSVPVNPRPPSSGQVGGLNVRVR